MWNHISVCLETVLVLAQDRCTVCAKRTISLQNCFGHTRWYSLVMRLQWKLILVLLEIVLILMQDRCTVCAKQGSEIISEAPDGTPR